jgi:hypothetical protein
LVVKVTSFALLLLCLLLLQLLSLLYPCCAPAVPLIRQKPLHLAEARDSPACQQLVVQLASHCQHERIQLQRRNDSRAARR